MNNHCKHRLIGIAAAFVPLLATAPLFGETDDVDDDDYNRTAGIYWHVDLKAGGKAGTTLSLYNIKNLPDTARMRQELTGCLQNALQCPLENVNFHYSPTNLMLRADCLLPARKRTFSAQRLLRPGLLRNCFQQAALARMQVTLSVPRLGYVIGPQESKMPGHSGASVYYTVIIKAGQETVNDISIEFGYRLNTVIMIAVLLAFMFIAPFLLIRRVRKRALMLAKLDATAAWFGYWRGHRLIMDGMWLGWVIVIISLDAASFFHFVLGKDWSVLNTLFIFVPPITVSLSCQYLSRPVWQRVRGVAWDRKTMFLNSFWQHAATILPLFFFIIGITSLFQDSTGALLWFAAAAVAQLTGALMYGKASKSIPRTLLGGELKERILELAQRAGVKIKQVFLMPARQLQMGNAFALRGRNVMITDYLLERLTKKETDCVMAHEIGHLKKGHTLFMSLFGFLISYLIIYFLISTATSAVPFFSTGSNAAGGLLAVNDWIHDHLRFPLAMIANLLLIYFISRRYERSADEFASLVTNDPESMVTALVKLSKMNLMPLGWGFWDENLSTHPSTLKRADAIAQRYRISRERLEVLLAARPGTAEGEGYKVPEEASDPALVFSSEFRTQKSLTTSLVLMFALAAASLMLGYLICQTELPSPLYWTGLLLVPLFYLTVVNHRSLSGYRRLQLRLGEKLVIKGFGPTAGRRYFVGITPEARPRLYENHTVWDIGFLTIDDTTMSYDGDKIRFSLPRENISAIAEGPSYPGWFGVHETYLRWTSGGAERVFHLHSLNGTAMTAIARQSKLLQSDLINWHKGETAGFTPAPAAAQQVMPEFPDVKGLSPREALTAKGFFLTVLFIAFLTFGLSALFHLGTFIAWYGFGMSVWCIIVSYLPTWRYRESGQK